MEIVGTLEIKRVHGVEIGREDDMKAVGEYNSVFIQSETDQNALMNFGYSLKQNGLEGKIVNITVEELTD